jgi:hypothetical protein
MSAHGPAKTGLQILHVSDLHFGKDHNFLTRSTGPNTAAMSLSAAISEDLHLQGSPAIDALVISGDVMTHGRWQDHQGDAIAVIGELRERLRLEPERIYIVPGNHDYEWYAAEASGGFVRQAIAAPRSGEELHATRYYDFLRRLCGDVAARPGSVSRIEASGFTLKLGLLDSCRITPSQFHEYGFVSLGQIKDVMRQLSRDVSGPEIRMLIMHHHVSTTLPWEPPSETADVSITLDAGTLVDRALEAGIALLLHGHQHFPGIAKITKSSFSNRVLKYADDRQLYILSAGSAGVRVDRRYPDVPNTYSLINVSAVEASVRIRAIHPSGDDGSTLLETLLPLYVCHPEGSAGPTRAPVGAASEGKGRNRTNRGPPRTGAQ